MTRVYTYSQPIDADIVDGFCLLQKGFTDQFVYYDKQSANRYMGLGRCIALPQMDGVEYEIEGPIDQPPVFFSFNRFDAGTPRPLTSSSRPSRAFGSCCPKWCLWKTSAGACCK